MGGDAVMLTEEEAKTKWCPHSDAPRTHRDGYCIGSECMAWRWDETTRTYDDTRTPKPDKFHKGHCGLAGKP
jgi:hypothetical protein